MLLKRRGRRNGGLLREFSEGKVGKEEGMDILFAPPGCSRAKSVRS
jgi:hypothetical protein